MSADLYCEIDGTQHGPLTTAQLKQLAQTDISFARWMAYGTPAAFLMEPIAWRLLLWLFPPEIDSLPFTSAEIRTRLRTLAGSSPAYGQTLFRLRRSSASLRTNKALSVASE